MAAAAMGMTLLRASLARRRLAQAVADAVVYLWLASMWLVFAATAVTEVGRFVCGGGGASCPVLAAASKVNNAAFLSMVLASPVATLLLIIRMVTDSRRHKPEKAPASLSITEALKEAMREMLRDTLIRGVLVAGAFIQLKLLVDLGGSCIKGSHWERICSVVRVVCAVGADAMYCFVIVPHIAKMWRKKQASSH